MNKASNSKRWFSAWWGVGHVQHDDFADMGTAFGLDQSIEASSSASLAASTERRAGAARPATSWVKKLTLRRRAMV